MKNNKEKAQRIPFDYSFGKPRIELSGQECVVDGIDSIVEYSENRIRISLGSQLITFDGDGLRINSFTREGALVEGNIMSMSFSQKEF